MSSRWRGCTGPCGSGRRERGGASASTCSRTSGAATSQAAGPSPRPRSRSGRPEAAPRQRRGRGRRAAGGSARAAPSIHAGSTGAPVSAASRATPRRNGPTVPSRRARALREQQHRAAGQERVAHAGQRVVGVAAAAHRHEAEERPRHAAPGGRRGRSGPPPPRPPAGVAPPAAARRRAPACPRGSRGSRPAGRRRRRARARARGRAAGRTRGCPRAPQPSRSRAPVTSGRVWRPRPRRARADEAAAGHPLAQHHRRQHGGDHDGRLAGRGQGTGGAALQGPQEEHVAEQAQDAGEPRPRRRARPGWPPRRGGARRSTSGPRTRPSAPTTAYVSASACSRPRWSSSTLEPMQQPMPTAISTPVASPPPQPAAHREDAGGDDQHAEGLERRRRVAEHQPRPEQGDHGPDAARQRVDEAQLGAVVGRREQAEVADREGGRRRQVGQRRAPPAAR